MLEKDMSTRHFDFTQSFLGRPAIGISTIRVPVRIFGVTKGYLGSTRDAYYQKCTLVYEGVTKSHRRVLEYSVYSEDGEKSGFKPEYTIVDGPFVPLNRQLYLFYLESVSEDLRAWVSWEITAARVRIEDAVPLNLEYREK